MARGSPTGPTFSVYLLPSGIPKRAAKAEGLDKPARVYRRPADVTRFVKEHLDRPPPRPTIVIGVSEEGFGDDTIYFGKDWLKRGLGKQYSDDMARTAQHRFYLRNRPRRRGETQGKGG